MINEDLNKINKTSPNLLDERLAELKRLFPDLFDGNGNLNDKELKDLLSEYTTPQVEKFTFEWGGKSASKKLAFTPSKATLVPDKERSVNFDDTQNLIIEADNLHALKLLQTAYANKVKCIYIDPPYNTGKDFIYSDNYRETEREYWEKNGQVHDGVKLDSNAEANGRLHSNWLSMMQSRLLLARKLLKDDGVIFVSIDDNEVHDLRKLMDEVFGEENYIANIVWKHTMQSKNDERHFSRQYNNILVFSKSTDLQDFKFPRTDEHNKNYSNPDEDPKGSWRSGDVRSPNPRPSLKFDIQTPSGKIIHAPDNGWRWSEESIKEKIASGEIIFSQDETKIIRKIYLDNQEGRVPENFWDGAYFGTTRDANREIKELFDGKAFFDTPKPVKLLYKIFQLTTSADDLVMDFFAGSGTTAHALMELNKDDGGNRKYIIVQIPEYTDENTEAYNAGLKKISDITIERVIRAGKIIFAEDPRVDTGFKVFRQTYSHFSENTWRPDPNKSNEENQKSFSEYLEKSKARSLKLFDDFEFEPILYEILLKQGFELTLSIEKRDTFKQNEVFKVKDGEKETLICLDQSLKQDTVDELIANHTKDRFICIENALNTTNKWKLSKALGKNLEVVG